MSVVTQPQQQASQQTSLDLRLLKASIQVNNDIVSYEDVYIRVRGCKYANPIQNECTLEIGNLKADTKNYILTEASPFNKNATAKILSIYAGRVSTGYALVYSGDITNVNPTQPPDVKLVIKASTGQFLKGQVGSLKGRKQQKLSEIAKQVAMQNGLTLDFQATDKNISNYAHSGAALKQVDKLGDLGAVSAYIDDNRLVVKDINLPLTGVSIKLSETTGMIGIPEVTEQGVRVTFLYVSAAQLGCQIQLTSNQNPSLNGNYVIYKLNFSLSNRETEFYYTAECIRYKT